MTTASPSSAIAVSSGSIVLALACPRPPSPTSTSASSASLAPSMSPSPKRISRSERTTRRARRSWTATSNVRPRPWLPTASTRPTSRPNQPHRPPLPIRFLPPQPPLPPTMHRHRFRPPPLLQHHRHHHRRQQQQQEQQEQQQCGLASPAMHSISPTPSSSFQKFLPAPEPRNEAENSAKATRVRGADTTPLPPSPPPSGAYSPQEAHTNAPTTLSTLQSSSKHGMSSSPPSPKMSSQIPASSPTSPPQCSTGKRAALSKPSRAQPAASSCPASARRQSRPATDTSPPPSRRVSTCMRPPPQPHPHHPHRLTRQHRLPNSNRPRWASRQSVTNASPSS